MRDIEQALSKGQLKDSNRGTYIADLGNARINCLNISDTVIFFTNDDSVESLEELLIVAHRFNWQEVFFNFPVRGVIYCDEIDMIHGQSENTVGAIYSANLIYGKGLVNAHLKCENLNWAGCVIDKTVIDRIRNQVDIRLFLEPYAKLYVVPYKVPDKNIQEEYALKLITGTLNDEAFKNYSRDVRDRFSGDNKPVDNSRVQKLIENTLTYLATFRE